MSNPPVLARRPAAPLLVLDLPSGGRARFYAQADLTPRRTRQLEVLTAHLGPLIAKVTLAARIANGDAVDERDNLPGDAFELTRGQAADLAELNDVAAWTYLKHIEEPNGERRELATVDDVLDLPGPVYDAVVRHAAQLFAASRDAGFGVDSLPENLEEADEDLPTLA